MSTISLPVDHHVAIAQSFANSFASNTSWLFVGDHLNHANTTVPNETDDVDDRIYHPWINMIMGKQLSSLNVLPGIKYIPYAPNQVYDMYDDQDASLFDKEFYVVVNATSFFHVFKVLDNNQGTNSVVTPDFTQIQGANVVSYETADGYRWKYMYTVDSATKSKFGTSDFFPVIANSATTSIASKGSINIIAVENEGKLYNNYITGTFSANDIRVFGDSSLYGLSNTQAVTSNGYYTGTILYLTGGAGLGQYRRVIDYLSNTVGNFMRLESPFSVNPQNGTLFELYPECLVFGNGDESNTCIARAIVNSTGSNSIATIEVLNSGQNYEVASATVVANAIVGVSLTANVRPILPPKGGHGFDPLLELNGSNIIVSANLSNSESNTILTTNQFQQVGIVRDPLFNLADLSLVSPTAFFLATEPAYIVNPSRAAINCTANTGNVTITGDSFTQFTQQFSVGELILITDNGTNNQIAAIASITNNNSMNLDSGALFSINNATLAYPQITSSMVVNVVTTETQITVANITGAFITGTTLVGRVSGASATVNTISRAGTTKDFHTFIQLHKYGISLISGQFIANEIVVQGTSEAFIHSTVGNTVMYLSNLSELFAANGTHVVGANSGAVASINTVYPQELVFGEGKMIYLENISAITRQPAQGETMKLVFEF